MIVKRETIENNENNSKKEIFLINKKMKNKNIYDDANRKYKKNKINENNIENVK